MLPQWAPWAGLKTLSYLLGREAMEDHENDDSLYPTHEDFCGELIPETKSEGSSDYAVHGEVPQEIFV